MDVTKSHFFVELLIYFELQYEMFNLIRNLFSGGFFFQLAYCVVQFMEKDATVTEYVSPHVLQSMPRPQTEHTETCTSDMQTMPVITSSTMPSTQKGHMLLKTAQYCQVLKRFCLKECQ